MYHDLINDNASAFSINDLVAKLGLLQKQAEKNFNDYARKIYFSKVQYYFPHLLTPTYEGCFIKMTDLHLDKDNNFVDQEQTLIVSSNDEQQILWSAISARILPFDVEATQCTDKQIEITLNSKIGLFSISDREFNIWIHSESAPIGKMIGILDKLRESTKSKILIEDASGKCYEVPVKITFGYNYPQHFNHQLRQKLADPRLQFRLNIELAKKIQTKLKSIKLILKPFRGCFFAKEDLIGMFHTNIFPMVNQKQAISDSFTMDGDHDICWLSVDMDTNILIHRVLSVYADEKKLDVLDYKVIYQDDRVGLEFNNISNVLNKSIFADVYISCRVNKSLLDNYRNINAKWFSQSLNTYKLKISSLILVKEQNHSQYDIERLLTILETCNVHKWKLQEWKSLLKITDICAIHPINNLLEAVSVDIGGNLKLYFKNITEIRRHWVGFYLEQLTTFIVHNSHHKVKIDGVFQ